MTDIGDQLLTLRKQRKQSRAEFAAAHGIKPGMLAAVEKGRVPKPRELELLEPIVAGNSSTTTTPIVLLNEDVEDADYEPLTVLTGVVEPDPVHHDGARLISNSEVQTFKRCRRKWYLGWHRGLRPKTEVPLGARAIGTQVHAALAAWYVPDGQSPTNPVDALESILIADWDSLRTVSGDDGEPDTEAVEKYKKQVDLVRAIVSGYMEWLAETGQDEGLTVIAPETELSCELMPGVKAIGKLDVRVRREVDGAHLFIDHKTVGSLTQPLRTLHLDEQMMHYLMLERGVAETGDHVGGALYNMLRKVKRTERATPPFYERVEVQHNDTTIESFKQRLIGAVTQMQQAAQSLDEGVSHLTVAYPTPNSNCAWDCDFLAVCSMMDDGSRADDYISEIYAARDPLDRYTDVKEVTE